MGRDRRRADSGLAGRRQFGEFPTARVIADHRRVSGLGTIQGPCGHRVAAPIPFRDRHGRHGGIVAPCPSARQANRPASWPGYPARPRMPRSGPAVRRTPPGMPRAASRRAHNFPPRGPPNRDDGWASPIPGNGHDAVDLAGGRPGVPESKRRKSPHVGTRAPTLRPRGEHPDKRLVRTGTHIQTSARNHGAALPRASSGTAPGVAHREGPSPRERERRRGMTSGGNANLDLEREIRGRRSSLPRPGAATRHAP